MYFQFSPENVCHEQKQSFQSELLEFLMDIIHITGQEGGQSTHVARDGKVFDIFYVRLLYFLDLNLYSLLAFLIQTFYYPLIIEFKILPVIVYFYFFSFVFFMNL